MKVILKINLGLKVHKELNKNNLIIQIQGLYEIAACRVMTYLNFLFIV